MELIGKILILIVFFVGLALLIHICSKNKYAIEYSSKERKIKIYPVLKQQDKSTKHTDKSM